MTIRRIGFNPFVNTANYIEAQKRIEAVEKHAGTDDVEVKSEEDVLAELNAKYQEELDAVEAERAQREAEAQGLRAKLTLSDGYETQKEGPVDLKGGVEEPVLEAEPPPDAQGVSLASLARANVYQTVSREEQRAAARQAELEHAAAQQAELERAAAAELDGASGEMEGVAGEVEGVDDDWMRAELTALQAQNDSVEQLDEAEEAYGDPGADSFIASLDDIANLEEPSEYNDPSANGFVASLDDIAHLVPETGAEEAPSAAIPEAVAQQASGETPPMAASTPEPSLMLPFDDEAPPAAAAPVALPFDSEPGPDSQV